MSGSSASVVWHDDGVSNWESSEEAMELDEVLIVVWLELWCAVQQDMQSEDADGFKAI
jgi:hypothetical protein